MALSTVLYGESARLLEWDERAADQRRSHARRCHLRRPEKIFSCMHCLSLTSACPSPIPFTPPSTLLVDAGKLVQVAVVILLCARSTMKGLRQECGTGRIGKKTTANNISIIRKRLMAGSTVGDDMSSVHSSRVPNIHGIFVSNGRHLSALRILQVGDREVICPVRFFGSANIGVGGPHCPIHFQRMSSASNTVRTTPRARASGSQADMLQHAYTYKVEGTDFPFISLVRVRVFVPTKRGDSYMLY